MNCPGCGSTMQHLALDGKLGTKVDVDLCAACRVIWFDHLKDLQLAPAGTLALFGIVSESTAQQSPVPGVLSCPRCGSRLALTHDMQRATKFQYWRCDRGDGRLIAFVDFLREKDFVRPLTAAQIDELRRSVRTINCGNCGAPIDLAKDSICAHCGSPLSMLDPGQMARTIAQLQSAAAGHADSHTAPDPDPHAPDFDGLMQALREETRAESSRGLIETGLRLLGDLLKRR